MEWTELAPAMLWAGVWLLAPGLIVAAALRLAVGSLVLLAPAFSVSVISVAAVAGGLLGFPFGATAVVAATITLALAAVAVDGCLSRPALTSWTSPARSPIAASGRPWSGAASIVGALMGAVLLAWQAAHVIGSAEAISQSYDAIFHLNAVRYIGDTGNGSSLTLGRMLSPEAGIAIYPAAWHDIVSLVRTTSGVSVPAATNAVTVAVMAIVWPFSVALLARSLQRQSMVSLTSAGVLSASFVGFPILMLKWGILYPNLLAFSLVPAALAALVTFRDQQRDPGAVPLLRRVFPLMAVLSGLALAHVNAIVAIAVIALAFGVDSLFRAAGAAASRKPWRREAAEAAVTCLTALGVWAVLNTGLNIWGPTTTAPRAVGEWVTNSVMGHPGGWLVSALVLLGVYRCVSQDVDRWIVWAWLAGGLLWVIAAGRERDALSALLIGSWYSDPHRLASMTVLTALPLAVHGVAHVSERVESWAATLPFESSTVPVRIALTLVAIAIPTYLATQSESMRYALAAANREFRLTEDSLLITSDELAVLARVGEFVPEDARIIVDPWEGSALIFALSDRIPTQFHSLSEIPDGVRPIVEGLRQANSDPEVCKAVRDLDAWYYLDFEDTLNIGADFADAYNGLDGVADTEVVTPLFRSGKVGLYEVTACR